MCTTWSHLARTISWSPCGGKGYSLPAAISDLTDNSITADARNLWLYFHWSVADSRVSILDDGRGMSETELVDAMCIDSRSPREEREADDLGRFCLGLKTASISQPRSLTVATRTVSSRFPIIRQWGLDHRAGPGDWLGLGFQKEEHYKLAPRWTCPTRQTLRKTWPRRVHPQPLPLRAGGWQSPDV